MRIKQSTVGVHVLVLALALSASLVLVAPSRATFPGHNGPIVFGARVAGGHQIFVVNPDGSGLRQVTQGTAGCFEPSIAPDGTTIAFVRSTSPSLEICTASTTDATPHVLASGVVDDPSFSPNGWRVVFVHDNQVWVMNVDGSQQRQLTRFGGHTHASSPIYSPNGKTIVFVAEVCLGRHSPLDRCKILAMKADGSHLRRLAYASLPDSTWNATLKTWTPPTAGVSFSPGGRRIVYGAERYATVGNVIRLMNADGTNEHSLPGSRGCGWPCYSPDGRRIVCLNHSDQLCVARVNGTHWRLLLSSFATEPCWGPQAH